MGSGLVRGQRAGHERLLYFSLCISSSLSSDELTDILSAPLGLSNHEDTNNTMTMFAVMLLCVLECCGVQQGGDHGLLLIKKC